MILIELNAVFAVCRLDAGAVLPDWAQAGEFWSLTRTRSELSLVCLEQAVPAEVRSEGGWRALMVEGPLDFALVGILADLAGVLAQAGVSLFAISTFDTDYLLVRGSALQAAAEALRAAGHTLLPPRA